MKKLMVVGALLFAFALSASFTFAAKPANPGWVGEAVSAQAHDWGGRGDVVSSIAVTGTYGAGVQAYLGH